MDITCNIRHTFTTSYMLPRAIHLPITLKSYLIRTSLNLDLELNQEASAGIDSAFSNPTELQQANTSGHCMTVCKVCLHACYTRQYRFTN